MAVLAVTVWGSSGFGWGHCNGSWPPNYELYYCVCEIRIQNSRTARTVNPSECNDNAQNITENQPISVKSCMYLC